MDTTPQGLISLNERYRADASGFQNLWRECGKMCLTRKLTGLLNSTSQSTTHDTGYQPETRLLNSVAVEANNVLAAGCMTWIMPSEGRWFVWKPAPEQEGNDALENWLQSCTEIALTMLFSSNFYTRAHEVLLDRSTFGTASLWAETGIRNPLNFRAWDVGTFVIGENAEGYVDTVFREIERTASQAVEEFPQVPPAVTNAMAANRPNEKFRFLHVIYPRPVKDQSPDGGPMGMPWASVWVHIDSKLKVKESGYEELPSFTTRYLRWSEASAYGVSPAMQALAEIRGVNYLEMLMATLAEVTVNPRLILPQGYQGVPDLRAGGITMGGLDQSSFPKEWMTGGRFDIGVNLIERKEKAINEAFHRTLFEIFSNNIKDINIPHVRALEAEKLARFSPAFTSLTTEFINPILERVFMLLYRSGRLPRPPREAFVMNSLGQPTLLFPRAVQNNRMSLAMQQAKMSGTARIFELFSMVAQAEQTGSATFDHFDSVRAFRDLTRGEGLPADYLRSEESVQAIQEARAQAAQAAEQKEMMMESMKSKPLVEEVIKRAA
ncbi:portal protein [Prosthecobacter sp. SYSU 5D2]|uniref:portal protein n=1 Tax=Prosthecobacter sp. SYSU 5D2 TaxID=3134134 RepID=UPI0031FF15B5